MEASKSLRKVIAFSNTVQSISHSDTISPLSVLHEMVQEDHRQQMARKTLTEEFY